MTGSNIELARSLHLTVWLSNTEVPHFNGALYIDNI